MSWYVFMVLLLLLLLLFYGLFDCLARPIFIGNPIHFQVAEMEMLMGRQTPDTENSRRRRHWRKYIRRLTSIVFPCSVVIPTSNSKFAFETNISIDQSEFQSITANFIAVA